MTAVETNGRRVAVTSEPRTYEPLGWSFFADMALSEHPERERGTASRERLLRHERELQVEMRSPSFSYADPPMWLVDDFAAYPRPDRVLSGLIERAGGLVPIAQKPGFGSVNVPRLTKGTKTAIQPPAGPGASADFTDAVASPSASGAGLDPLRDPQTSGGKLINLAGNCDIPLQMLEQRHSGLGYMDSVLYRDLDQDYNAQLESQLIVGTGGTNVVSAQLLGLLNIAGTNAISYTDASPTVTEMVQTSGQGGPLALALAAVGNQRRRKPEVWMMTTSRAAWMASGEIAFPLALSGQEGPGAFGLLSYPAVEDDAIPTNLGAGGNQDVIIACRPSDMLLFESAPTMNAFTEVLSGDLEARVQLRRYAAFVGGRYPSGISIISGTGMTIAAGF
jgi:hypothetical protein